MNRAKTAVGRVTALRLVGDRAFLAELDSLDAVMSLQAQLHEGTAEGVVDVVAAAKTVLITADSPESAARLMHHVRSLVLGTVQTRDSRLVTIEVVYDGEDLDDVARLAGLSREGVVKAHSSEIWSSAFTGFAPGFAYLIADGRLDVPRRSSPRTAVPAGSVALAGGYSAVYPRSSPGGWQLIGRTDAPMWDSARTDPALIRPGDSVRFAPVRATAAVRGPEPEPEQTRPAAGKDAGLIVADPGLQSTVQDLGREGNSALGVSVSGAMDRSSLRRANRIAGNPEEAAAIETLLGGLRLRAVKDQVLAVSGAPVPLEIGARHPAMDAPFALLAGETLALGRPSAGLRTYVAVRGGIGVDPVLGSRSTDTLSGLGPEPLAAGSSMRVLPAPPSSVVGHPEVPPQLDPAGAVLRVVLGPRDSWFTQEAIESFLSQEWTVTPQSNRVGLRLNGSPLKRASEGELASEGVIRGSIQVPPNGQPLIFLSDHPVTGGYPVIGVVVSADLDKAGQIAPGGTVQFQQIQAPVAPSGPEGPEGTFDA
ncbi:5-oxoprolinase/urea amidolyase family protein [Sinomonas sp. JGH33]|uniref:5-oxoprolinase/urea amidolyase family protein n=1 Tax=Sinomonas terricola TaxID=3110330 RepID=A0ABU5TC19_9MICC|nr:5-oxoprolinase/urea amidolyase family protein [Sinomonas sp. JGH33]MEA5457234.1 5-oxoprolinase/urea amidolyase family protein [Sinomonas sp. JGH33]